MNAWKINSGDEEALYDIADEVNDQYIEKGGGGGGSSDKQGKKTRRAKKEIQIEHSQEKRKEETKEDLKKVIENFPDFENEHKEEVFLERYTSWVNACLQSNELIFDEKNDIELKFARSGKKAGGQNVNKVSSAAICKHEISNIKVRNEETRSQKRNREKALELLKSELMDHIEDWNLYLNGTALDTKILTNL